MSTKKPSRRKVIQKSDPGKILGLVMNLTDDSCAELQTKINTYLCEQCEAEIVYQIVINVDRKEAFIEAIGKYLSQKFRVEVTTKMEDIIRNNQHVPDLLINQETDFLEILRYYMPVDNPKTRIVMLPMMGAPFSVIVCVVGPKVLDCHVPILVQECFLFVWPTLKKAIAMEYECALKQKCQQLLRVARRLFTQVASRDLLLKTAREQLKQLTRAEYCNVMLIDSYTMELVDTPYMKKRGESESKERRLPLNKGITGEALSRGILINVKNANGHPSFDTDIDSLPDVNCKSILCFPIREQSGIIGVGQVLNKIGEPHFNTLDEEMALAFGIYCGVCFIHSTVFQKVQEAHIRNALANELVMYHVKVSDEDLSRILDCKGYHDHPHLNSIHFNPRALPLRELPCHAYRMFNDLGFVGRFNLRKEKLARFILMVKKGYRDVPYHNWLHAFSVAQWAYAALINFKLVSKGYFTDLQALMFLVASLMHDLDHRGVANGFSADGRASLSTLYCSEGSVMERHHLTQALCILNTEGCDVLESLPRRDYDRALIHLKEFILATDLNQYFKNKAEYEVIALDFIEGNIVHMNALSCVLMTCANLGDQVREWGCVKKTAASVLAEFFRQSEEEKERGELPMLTMGKEKIDIADIEMDFLNEICIPLFKLAAKMLPKLEPCIEIMESHVQQWDGAKAVFAEVPITAGLSVLLSPELDNLIEINLKEKELERQRLAELGSEEEEDSS